MTKPDEKNSPPKTEKYEKTLPSPLFSSTKDEEKISPSKIKKIEKTSPESLCSSVKLINPNEETLSTQYNPAKSNYHPVNDAFWHQGQRFVVNFAILIRLTQLII